MRARRKPAAQKGACINTTRASLLDNRTRGPSNKGKASAYNTTRASLLGNEAHAADNNEEGGACKYERVPRC
ncbi:hypothetical protein NDU88_003794 [Pleurodeles waltl]|uniref:Uncharacterized protein n=1 Tax=Pleurodeles waltl TaxID=8319 RepID=A0AAV7UDJ2_PLEWA|nr:hypothetical protein NDU88_003794 [Pleurodeles waltl]